MEKSYKKKYKKNIRNKRKKRDKNAIYEYSNLLNKSYDNSRDDIFINSSQLRIFKLIYHLFLIFLIFLILYFLRQYLKKNKNNRIHIEENIDKFEINIYNNIKDKLENSQCTQITPNLPEFLNGIIRKFKPKKILEIGVNEGGNSIVILNAIHEAKNSHLYSIDISNSDKVGYCINKYFPSFLNKWRVFKGDTAEMYMEEIGKNIDMAFINSANFNPEGILNFLVILPFLNNNAIICFIDKSDLVKNSRLYKKGKENDYSLYNLLNLIRGKKYFPSGNQISSRDVGAIRLDRNQFNYVHEYFRVLKGQWQYVPSEIHINKMKELFKKYYDDECLTMFEKAISLNIKT